MLQVTYSMLFSELLISRKIVKYLCDVAKEYFVIFRRWFANVANDVFYVVLTSFHLFSDFYSFI